MKLIIIRHAAAIGKDEGIIDDYRYLTEDGRQSFRNTAALIKKKVRPSVILTSPMLRAVQTADVLAEALRYKGPLVVRNELIRNFGPSELSALVRQFETAKELVLVGHDPDFSRLAARFLHRPGFAMKKGAAIKLKLDQKDGELAVSFRWMATGKKIVTALDELE